MTNSLTSPPELVQQWATSSPLNFDDENWGYELFIAHHAAQWGADQELKACCEWLIGWDTCEGERLASLLREGRRPKPPSLKEQALEVLGNVQKGWGLAEVDLDTIRRALEALSDD
jgi:hypothetical protein